jgi:hypothetical protein
MCLDEMGKAGWVSEFVHVVRTTCFGLGFFSTFIVLSSLLIYATGSVMRTYLPSDVPSPSSSQLCDRSAGMTSFAVQATQYLRFHSWNARRSSIAAKVLPDKLLILS